MFRVLILILVTLELSAQQFNAAPNLGMGNTGIANKGLFNLTNNPAGTHDIPSVSMAMGYQHHFVGTGLRSQAVYFGMPLKPNTVVGLSMNNFGISEVSSFVKIGASYIRKFDSFISSSISVNHHRFLVRNYQNDQSFSVDLGIQLFFLEEIVFGALFRNISDVHFREDTEQLINREFAVGVLYNLSNQVQVTADYYYDFYNRTNYRGGLSYVIDRRFKVNGGASSHPLQYYGGLGMRLKALNVDIASAFHSQLGSSPQLALSYAF